MNYKINPVSKKFKLLYQKARYKVLYGGRGSGKSWAVVEALLFYAINYTVRILCTREIQRSIEASSYQLIVDTIGRLGMDDKFLIQKTKITCLVTGSTFIFSGLSDNTSASLKSMESIDICWVEEAQTITQKSLNILKPTIRKPGSEVWFTFNPYMIIDPVYKMFVKKHHPRCKIAKINYDENPMLSQESLNDALDDKKNSDLYEHIWLGECIAAGDFSIIASSLLEEAYNREIIHQPNYEVIAGLDVARSGRDRSVLYIRRGCETLAIIEWATNKIDNEWTDEVLEICAEYNVDEICVDGDGLGAGAFDLLNEKKSAMGIRVTEVRGGRTLSVDYFNVRSQLYFKAREFMADGLGGVLPSLKSHGATTEQMDTLYEELTAMTYLPNKHSGKLQATSKDDIKTVLGRSPDYADAFIYSLCNYGKEKNVNDNAAVRKKLYGY